MPRTNQYLQDVDLQNQQILQQHPSLPSKPAIPTRVPIQIRISQPVRSPRISSHVRDPVTTQASTPIIATTVGCNFVQNRCGPQQNTKYKNNSH